MVTMEKTPTLSPAPSYHTLPPQGHVSQPSKASTFTSDDARVVIQLTHKTSQVVKSVGDRALSLAPQISAESPGSLPYRYSAQFQKDSSFTVARSSSTPPVNIGTVKLARNELTITFLPNPQSGGEAEALKVSFADLTTTRYIDIPPATTGNSTLRWSILAPTATDIENSSSINSSENPAPTIASLHMQLSLLSAIPPISNTQADNHTPILAEYTMSSSPSPHAKPPSILHGGDWGTVTVTLIDPTTDQNAMDRALITLLALVETYVRRLGPPSGTGGAAKDWHTIVGVLLCSVM